MTPLWVAAGGALGAVARYGLGGWVQRAGGAPFPFGTLTVNVIGSLLIGVLMVALRGSAPTSDVRMFLIVGVLGGFTTFSAFSWETAVMLQDGAWARAALYVLGSVALGLVAVLLGIALGESLLSA